MNSHGRFSFVKVEKIIFIQYKDLGLIGDSDDACVCSSKLQIEMAFRLPFKMHR
jgi:hypothetical protein